MHTISFILRLLLTLAFLASSTAVACPMMAKKNAEEESSYGCCHPKNTVQDFSGLQLKTVKSQAVCDCFIDSPMEPNENSPQIFLVQFTLFSVSNPSLAWENSIELDREDWQIPPPRFRAHLYKELSIYLI